MSTTMSKYYESKTDSEKYKAWQIEKEKLKKKLTPREYLRAIESHKYQLTQRAGEMIFNDLTGRTKFNKGAHDEPTVNITQRDREHRSRQLDKLYDKRGDDCTA